MRCLSLVCIILIVLFVIDANCQQGIDCKPGEVVQIDCNTCRCIAGKLACTRKHCVTKTRREIHCVAGLTKRDDCNTCSCSAGHWVCTQNICATRRKRSVPVAADLKNTPCAPNDYFKIDCNTCYCNIDKSGYLCTENLCPSIDSAATTTNTTNTTVIEPLSAIANNLTTSVRDGSREGVGTTIAPTTTYPLNRTNV